MKDRDLRPRASEDKGHLHYSDKGGHKERSRFWHALRKLAEGAAYSPTKELVWLIRRDMPRHPRNGK